MYTALELHIPTNIPSCLLHINQVRACVALLFFGQSTNFYRKFLV